MAKTISVADALAALAANGVDFEALGMSDAVAELTSAALKSRAVEIIGGNGDNLPGKLISKPELSAEEWTENLFTLAESFVEDFASDVKNVQGGAVRTVRVVGIETPFGHLKIELKSE